MEARVWVACDKRAAVIPDHLSVSWSLLRMACDVTYCVR